MDVEPIQMVRLIPMAHKDELKTQFSQKNEAGTYPWERFQPGLINPGVSDRHFSLGGKVDLTPKDPS